MENKYKHILEAFGERDKNGKKWEDYDTIVCPDGQVIDMVKLLEEQSRAKAALVHIIPFFGAFINKLQPVYTFMIPTQAVDGKHLFINPQFTANMDLTGKVFVLAHEIMHCVLNHMRRGEGHDPTKSNIAADYEVNAWIVDVDLVRASDIKKVGALYDKKYSSWGYEKIYADNPPGPNDSMQPDKSQQQQAQKNQDQNQQGDGQGGSQQYSDDYKAGWRQAMEDYKNGKLKI